MYVHNNPINHVDPLGLGTIDETFKFVSDWGANTAQAASDLSQRTGKNIVEGTLTLSDCLGYGASAIAGRGENYQGNSQLFKKIYDSPESFGDPNKMRSEMAKDALLTAGTLGLNRVEDSLFKGDAKGVQDAFVANLLLVGGAEMGGAGSVKIPLPTIAAIPSDGALALDLTLTPVTVIPGQATAATGTLVNGAGVMMSAEHTKGARPSTQEKHQKGQSRKKADQQGEKADERRGENRDQPRRDRRGQVIE
jgi:hypothetical protein